MSQLVAVSRVNPHLPHDSEELQSPPPPDALDNDMALRNASEIVGRLLQHEVAAPTLPPATARTADTARATPPHRAPMGRPVEAPPMQPSMQPRSHTRTTAAPPRGAARLPELACDPEEAELRAALTADAEMAPDPRGGLRLRVSHAIAIACTLGLVLWPVGFAALLLALAVAAIAGAALLRRAVARGHWRRFANRYPRRAEKLRRRADRAAERLDRVLDFLPDAMAERLALPDLSMPPAGGRRHR